RLSRRRGSRNVRFATLGTNAVDVWWAARSDAAPQLEALLDDVERERRAAYRRDEDGDRFLVGCALAKVALGEHLGRSASSIRLSRTCPTCGKPHGKPA